jgi:hypothetical protein
MYNTNREIHELLVDYAGALRDGRIPAFLKSLTREEARRIASSQEFWDATETTRVLNGVGFADKAVTSNVGLFISRVDAKVASRLKKRKASAQEKSSTTGKTSSKGQNRIGKSA